MAFQNNNSIAILIAWFGNLPWYFDYFLHSCRYNPDVNFIILTDAAGSIHETPSNVVIVHRSFEDVKRLIKQRLQMPIALEFAYKICDFRPAFGLVFSDLLKDYEFWGMGDIDVIFGNIRKFITPEILQNHDIITVRHDFLVGYFTLFRNCPLVNELFRESRDYERVFTSRENYCFDESNYAYGKMNDVIGFEDVKCEIESMTHVVKRMQAEGKIRAYFDVHAIEGRVGMLKWDNGTLIYKNRYEVILYHLILFKLDGKCRKLKTMPASFRISPTRIY